MTLAAWPRLSYARFTDQPPRGRPRSRPGSGWAGAVLRGHRQIIPNGMVLVVVAVIGIFMALMPR